MQSALPLRRLESSEHSLVLLFTFKQDFIYQFHAIRRIIVGMATMSVENPIQNLSTYLSFNVHDSSFKQVNRFLKKALISYILISYGQCKLNSARARKETKPSTVAAHASDLDPVVANESNNFEYDDNEWDVKIGNLIIDLDADIEKNLDTDMASAPSSIQNSENSSCSDNTYSSGQLSSSATSSTVTINTQCSKLSTASSQILTNRVNTSISETGHCGKMAVEHSAIVDKGLKMKIKRTKPGTKSSEAKHEIVKSTDVNSMLSNQDGHDASGSTNFQCMDNAIESPCSSFTNKSKSPHTMSSVSGGSTPLTLNSSKRNSSSHRREKGRERHEKIQNVNSSQGKFEVGQNHSGSPSTTISSQSPTTTTTSASASSTPISVNDQTVSSTVYVNSSTASTSSALINTSTENQPIVLSQQIPGSILGSRPPGTFQVIQSNVNSSQTSNHSPTYSSNITSATCSTTSAEQVKCSTGIGNVESGGSDEPLDSINSPPAKKLRSILETESKEMLDVCVGTSIGTITEPDCLGPCEPGTSVTLEGIVWHETEGGVLVVNITWRGKTYVGTLLDCTRHDWAPPRFCDSPTSDLDIRTPKGRSKRGRAAANIVFSNDLSNFTETRTSVHSKLRNNGTKGRRGAPTISPGCAAFVPPRTDPSVKRKSRYPEEDEKSKRKLPPPNVSPPMSPVLLECPEPNCNKKYKHMNGLKYHQSHAHGSIEDEDTKEQITSMSENDESNIEAPSPMTPVKSPADKSENTPNRPCSPTVSSDNLALNAVVRDLENEPSSTIVSDNNVKDSPILRYDNDELSISVDSTSPSIETPQKSQQKPAQSKSPNFLPAHSPILNESPPLNSSSLDQYGSTNMIVSPQSHQPLQMKQSPAAPSIVMSPVQEQPNQNLSFQSSNYTQNQPLNSLVGVVVSQNSLLHELSNPTSGQTTNQSISMQSHLQAFPNIGNAKIPQFKVKPTAALMPEQDKSKDVKSPKASNFKKKSRKSPLSSPNESSMEAVVIDSGRDDLQSPAYSDISDDATPAEETDSCDKLLKQNPEKQMKPNPQSHLTHFNMYPYYGQSSYIIQNIHDKNAHETKMNESTNKGDMKSLNIVSIPSLTNLQNLSSDKEKKESTSLPQSQSHYYTNYNAYISGGYQFQPQSGNSQSNQDAEYHDHKHRIKQETPTQKEKHLENHQILKESIEIKSQMNPYQLYSQNRRSPPTGNVPSDERRYYVYSGEQRRKEESSHKQTTSQKSSLTSPKHQSKLEKTQETTKSEENKNKQEGVKPTMETQGPPPPPTSQYAYIHPGYLPSHHYTSISYDPGHPGIYRNLTPMIVPGTYTNNPYLHQIPRYTPEDLSRTPGGKALDLLQHHANQYYSAHKIHELQERALKSPTPKISAASSPLSNVQPVSIRSPTPSSAPTSTSQTQPSNTKQQSQNANQHQQQQQPSTESNSSLNKDSRSPPPQRHVHTHHHTHVGLGYPILPGQYPAPYGAVLASQQAAAVAATVISPFPPK